MSRTGDTFIVTGGASGLGEATVRLLHKQGGNVCIADRDQKKAEALVSELGDTRLMVARVDVTSEEEVKACVDGVVEHFGGLQGLVNCAGIAGARTTVSKRGVFPDSLFQKIISINLTGSFHFMKYAAMAMSTQPEKGSYGRGVLVNTASVAAFDGQKGQVAYSASKGALVAMALPMARDLARYNIRVNTIAPGIFGTPLMLALNENAKESLLKDVVAPRRYGFPDEFALCVTSILDNQYMNAACVRLDGGIRMSNL